MKIVTVLLLICLVSCQKKVPYRQVVFSEQALLVSVPALMRQSELMAIGNDMELIRMYYLPDSSCSIMLEISREQNKDINELLEIEKIKLPVNYVNSVLVSTYVNNSANIKHAGIKYKADDSGDNINTITIYSVDRFMVKISIGFLRSYNGVLGENRDVIKRVTESLRIMK